MPIKTSRNPVNKLAFVYDSFLSVKSKSAKDKAAINKYNGRHEESNNIEVANIIATE